MQKISTFTITSVLVFLGIVIAFATVQAIKAGIIIAYPEKMIMLMLIFFLWGLSGFVFVLRQQVPQIMLKGKPAIVVGMTLMIIFWGFTIYGFYLLIASFFE